MSANDGAPGATVQISSDEYLALKAIGKYQLLEFVLKVYVSAAASGTEKSIKFSALEGNPLGTLIKKYKALSGNEAMVARLNEIKGHRNRIAHSALAYSLPEIADLLPHERRTSLSDLAEWLRVADRCLADMALELAAVLGGRGDGSAVEAG